MQQILKDKTIAEQIDYVANERFAWPGGYALGLFTDSGDCICSACVRANRKNIVRDTLEDKCGDWQVSGAYISDADDDAGEWNDDCATTCSHCGRPITDATSQPA